MSTCLFVDATSARYFPSLSKPKRLLLDIRLTLHQTLAFVWETGRYFEPRQSTDAQLMLSDGTLNTRSKGTPTVFPHHSLLSPPIIVSLCRRILGSCVLNTLVLLEQVPARFNKPQ
jgi:hypothetical protein